VAVVDSPGALAIAERQAPEPVPWEDLGALIHSGQVVPVIGDAAMTVRWEDEWRTFSDALAERFASECRLSREPHEGVSDLAIRALRDRQVPILKSKFRRIHDETLNKTHAAADLGRSLHSLCALRGFPLILTTCAHGLLERALSLVRATSPDIVVLGESEALDLPPAFEPSARATLVHLFGKVSSRLKFPLTEEDLLESLRWLYETRPARLLDQLESRNLLLIGNGFPDWLTRMFIRSLRRDRLSDDRSTMKWLAEGETARDPKLVLFLESLASGIFVYGGSIDDFVAKIYATAAQSEPESSASRTAASREPPESTVFLSFSLNDRSAAEAVVRCLRARNLDVWYEAQELVAGDVFDAKIPPAIKNCVFFMCLLSRHTENQREGYFRQEWGWALQRLPKQTGARRRFIVPLIIDDLDPRSLTTLPDAFTQLSIQSAPRGQVPEELLDELVRELREIRVGSFRVG
jgi:hypothetical protein